MAAETMTARGREMQRVLGQCARSGLTMAEFARRRGISPQTLAWWRHRLRSTAEVKSERKAAGTPARFTEVVFDAQSGVPGVVEVVLRNGRVLRVPLAGADAEALRVLVRLLEETC
jgi:transposase-like protein